MRTETGRIGAMFAVLLIFTACTVRTDARAATSTATVTINITIEPSSQLTLSTGTTAGGVHRNRTAGAIANVRPGSTPAVLTVTGTNDSDENSAARFRATASDTAGNILLEASGRDDNASGPKVRDECLASYSETFNWYLSRSWSCSGRNSVKVIYTLTSP